MTHQTDPIREAVAQMRQDADSRWHAVADLLDLGLWIADEDREPEFAAVARAYLGTPQSDADMANAARVAKED